MPKRIRITASIGSTPALVIMGMAMEPIMMIAPKPLIPKKTNAVAAVIKVAKAYASPPHYIPKHVETLNKPSLLIISTNIKKVLL
jgi:hypothetical protein